MYTFLILSGLGLAIALTITGLVAIVMQFAPNNKNLDDSYLFRKARKVNWKQNNYLTSEVIQSNVWIKQGREFKYQKLKENRIK